MKLVLLPAFLLALTATPAVPAQTTNAKAERQQQQQQTEQRTAKSRTGNAQRAEHRRRLQLRRAEQRRQREQRNAERQRQRAVRMAAINKRRADQQEIRTALNYRRLVVPTESVRSAIDKVNTGLDWKFDLGEAQAMAQRSGKPIVWVQALGDLRGVL